MAAACEVNDQDSSAEVRFFVTGPNVFAMTTMDGRASAAGGMFHAKTFGTNNTACGIWTGSWTKLWDVAFDPVQPAACRACVAAVRALRAAVEHAARTRADTRDAASSTAAGTGSTG